MPWSPASWQNQPAAQQPVYPDAAALRGALGRLAKLPPLVSSYEIETLKSQLGEAARGERFLLQGGDCAESLEDCESSAIANKLKILLQMSLVLTHGLGKRVIRVGRFAGQYAKPRSSETETRFIEHLDSIHHGEHGDHGEETNDSLPPPLPHRGLRDPRGESISLPAYRGDLINRAEFTLEGRTPDPQLMLRGYERAALTLNFIRALIDGGFADLHHPENWNLEFVREGKSRRGAEYQRVVEEIGHSLRFAETLAGQPIAELTRVDFFTSHEGLHLLYEQAQTRQVPRREGWYNLSTHFPWIGMRTADVGGAHVEYCRGIRNPIAVKIGPVPPTGGAECGSIGEHITKLMDVLHVDDEPGRFTIIHRFGAQHVERRLPELIRAVHATGKTVLWCCDPMHGNTETAETGDIAGEDGIAQTLAGVGARGGSGSVVASSVEVKPSRVVKFRRFENVVAELQKAMDIHKKMGTCLGGVHVELTGENVVECSTDGESRQSFSSQVDPRLNYEQSLELAMLIARQAR